MSFFCLYKSAYSGRLMWRDSCSMWPYVTVFFCFGCYQGSSMWKGVSGLHPFSWPTNIPVCAHSALWTRSSVMAIWVIPTFWFLGLILPWTFMCLYYFLDHNYCTLNPPPLFWCFVSKYTAYQFTRFSQAFYKVSLMYIEGLANT